VDGNDGFGTEGSGWQPSSSFFRVEFGGGSEVECFGGCPVFVEGWVDGDVEYGVCEVFGDVEFYVRFVAGEPCVVGGSVLWVFVDVEHCVQ